MATCLLAVIVASLIVPTHLMISTGSENGVTPLVDASSKSSLPWSSISFSQPIDTSQTVLEYPLVSRALMLPGGSTDVTMGDINGDGLDDIIVAVSDEMMISIFYGHTDGSFSSYPTHNITLTRIPLAISTIDPNANGSLRIALLEQRIDIYDSEHLVLYRYISDESYERIDKTVYDNPNGFVVGEFSGDSYPDIAFSCTGDAPSIEAGSIEILKGPTYTSHETLNGGNGSNHVDAGDFNDDGLQDIALCNYYDSSIGIYIQPDAAGFVTGASPAKVLSITGSPIALSSNQLDSDSTDDLVVICDDASSTNFYFQSLNELPTTPDLILHSDHSPSALTSGDLDSDGSIDIVVLSSKDNVAMVFFQKDSSPIWTASPDVVFPTGSEPRAALIWNVSDLSGMELLVASARSDWSGSHLSVYSTDLDNLRNSNATIWTDVNYEAAALATGDIDGDDHEDIITIYPALNSICYFLNAVGPPNTRLS